jgi:hypothetical protein
VKYAVATLSGALLDAAVAKAQGLKFDLFPDARVTYVDGDDYQPSADWLLAGPIIERERITVVAFTGYNGDDPLRWWAQVGDFSHYIDEPLPGWQEDRCGPTPLIAAMRCLVASKFGDEVELP